jgi:hypothetical protein
MQNETSFEIIRVKTYAVFEIKIEVLALILFIIILFETAMGYKTE